MCMELKEWDQQVNMSHQNFSIEISSQAWKQKNKYDKIAKIHISS